MQVISKEQMQVIFSSDEFHLLLSQEVSKQLSSTHITSSLEVNSSVQPPKTMQISEMIAEISQNLEQIITFNIKQALQHQYGLLLQESAQIKNDFEDLRQEVLKISIKNAGKNIIEVKPTVDNSDFNDIDDLLDNHSKIGSKEYAKLKKEIQSIKVMLLRFTNSNTTILEQIDASKKVKLEQRVARLGKDVHQLLQNSDGANILQNISLQKCLKDMQEVVERQKKFQTNICEKYETSLKSVWNVITMMETNLEQQRFSGSGDGSPVFKK